MNMFGLIKRHIAPLVVLCCLVCLALLCPGPAEAQCPTSGIGVATGCGLLITVTAVDTNGNATAFTVTQTNPTGGNNGNPYDRVEDTLVGIVNNDTTNALRQISITSTSFALGFDGDGPCAFNSSDCFDGATQPLSGVCTGGSACYEGPNNTFTVTDANHGAIVFKTPLAANGGSTWCALEGSPQSLTPPTMQVVTTGQTNFNNNQTTDTIVSVVFDGNNGQHVEGDADFPPSNVLSFPPNIDRGTVMFQETNRFVADCQSLTRGTPFATCIPFDHAGDDAMAGTPGNGAKYEIICGDANNSPSEANCPTPTQGKHIRFKDIFDLPKDGSGNFIQPAIAPGTTVSFLHWFPNTHPEVTSWSPSPINITQPACTNVSMTMPPAAQTFACDIEDALVNKYAASNGFGSDTKKGDYLLVNNIPMLTSLVKVNGTQVSMNTPPGTETQGNSTFFFHQPLTFDFLVSPAQCNPALPVACGNGWLAAPVNYLFYTFDLISGPPPDLPGATDFEDTIFCPGANCPVPNGTICPLMGSCNVTSGTPGAGPPAANVEFKTTGMPENEGQYLLQWSAADSVKIRERNIQILTAGTCPNPFNDNPAPTPPCYSTKLFNVPITVDNTPPGITTSFTIAGPPFILNGPNPTLNFTCTDPLLGDGSAGSGIQVCGISTANVHNPPSMGPASFTGSDGPLSTATPGPAAPITISTQDVAGNTASTKVNYSILYSTGPCLGDAGHQILQPINADGTSVWKQGRTIPVKFRVCDANGNSIGAPGVISSFVLVQIISGTVANVDETIDATVADSGFRFDPTAQQWIFNLSTKTQSAGVTYVWNINLNDGSTIAFQYGLR